MHLVDIRNVVDCASIELKTRGLGRVRFDKSFRVIRLATSAISTVLDLAYSDGR